MISKVILANGTTMMDISDSTVTQNTLLQGTVAYNSKGERIVGTMNVADYIVETGQDDTWYWEKWNSGKLVLVTRNPLSTGTLTMTSDAGQYYSNVITVTLPVSVTEFMFMNLISPQYAVSNFIYSGSAVSGTSMTFAVIKQTNATGAIRYRAYIVGKWK